MARIVAHVLDIHSRTGDIEDAITETGGALGLNPFDVWTVLEWVSLDVSPATTPGISALRLAREDDPYYGLLHAPVAGD